MKTFFKTIGILVVVAGVVTVLYYLVIPEIKLPNNFKRELVIPSDLFVYLSNKDEPVLVITVGGGNSGCMSAEDVNIRKTYTPGIQKFEVIDYILVSPKSYKNLGCPANAPQFFESIPIDLSWFEDNMTKVIINLSGKENILKLSYENQELTLTAEKLENTRLGQATLKDVNNLGN